MGWSDLRGAPWRSPSCPIAQCVSLLQLQPISKRSTIECGDVRVGFCASSVNLPNFGPALQRADTSGGKATDIWDVSTGSRSCVLPKIALFFVPADWWSKRAILVTTRGLENLFELGFVPAPTWFFANASRRQHPSGQPSGCASQLCVLLQ